ncbi:GTPase-activating Rap/Ran-GAP domain-like protein 3 isoform X2 [Nematostella vectensis]|uniref:GTPase-activating Rap/Ran-GAP domain-like protein 3 isoform X2 n=1 Tax=Nematostella vectensis TaxID=45351 RepID=UPI002076F848|nr:GTPase-activating Rap/Ran-GAP domain-like protein 3 isoform X2 [Nematostella vectensis]
MSAALKSRRRTDKTTRPQSLALPDDERTVGCRQRPALHKRYSSPAGVPSSNGLHASADDLDWQRIPSPDVSRRSGLSRRHYYGSLETQNELSNSGNQGSVVHLENPEFHTRWYFKYFLGKVHQNYVALDGIKNPIVLSVCLTDADNYGVPQYRAILWRKTGSERICIVFSPNKPISAKVILKSFGVEKLEKGPREVSSPEFQQELLTLEEQEGSVNYKFGVLYAKAGQTSDDEMFSNETGSEEFNRFLKLLGDRVELHGWQGYRGGLDVKNDMTGSQSVFTVYEGHEIMFHVSSLLPYTPDNPQQVERKRHIGNDIVTIVFQDTDDEYKPSFSPLGVKSKFIHIFALVTYNKHDDSYRVTVYSERNVPIFGPPLPCPPVFHSHLEFRNFLLVKLINGEKAAYASPIFSIRRQRTLDSLITRLWQDHMHEKLSVRNSWGNAISESPRGHRRKHSEREQLFLQFGQSLKLKTIVKGDAPTSLQTSTSANIKVEPWQPQFVYEDFPHKVLCGDSWGDSVLLGTEEGIYLVQEGKSMRQLFDRSVICQQLYVLEAYGLLLFRVEKSKEFHNPRVCVFKLSDLEEDEDVVFTREDCKKHKLDRTKGCHLFAALRSSQPLFLAVACGRKVALLKWKHPLVWSSWAVGNVRDMTEGFELIREVTFSEPAILLTILLTESQEPLLCAGYKNNFDLVQRTGEIKRVHSVDTQKKTTLVSAIDVYEDHEPELLLTFNHQSVFKRLNGKNSSNFYLNWNSAPQFVVCAFPYLLAFTTNTIEIRLVVNGNLVHTLVLPNLRVITSKLDIFFTASTPQANGNGQQSPSALNQRDVTSVYKISLFSLMGQFLSPVPTVKIPEDTALPPQLLSTPISDQIDGERAARRVSWEPAESNPENTLVAKATVTRTKSCPVSSCAHAKDERFTVWTRRESDDLTHHRRAKKT